MSTVVADAYHTNLAFSPNARPRWYTASVETVRVPSRVPLDLVLQTGIAMAPAAKVKMHVAQRQSR